MGIVWKDVAGTNGVYQVSRCGKVKSLNRINCKGARIKGRELMQHSDGKGYVRVNLSIDSETFWRGVHRLVAQTFIPNPHGYETVDHIDMDKTNNTMSNLRWCTNAENILFRSKAFHEKNGTQDKFSEQTGVSWDKKAKKWSALISIGGKQYRIGTFSTEQKAIDAYKDVEYNGLRAIDNYGNKLKGSRFQASTGRYKSVITLNKKSHHIGTFTTAQEAHDAWKDVSENGLDAMDKYKKNGKSEVAHDKATGKYRFRFRGDDGKMKLSGKRFLTEHDALEAKKLHVA